MRVGRNEATVDIKPRNFLLMIYIEVISTCDLIDYNQIYFQGSVDATLFIMSNIHGLDSEEFFSIIK